MSKAAKEAQGYSDIGPVCGNCKHYQSQMVIPAWMRRENEKAVEKGMTVPFDNPAYATEEKGKRCSIGEFAVKKMAWCKKWESV